MCLVPVTTKNVDLNNFKQKCKIIGTDEYDNKISKIININFTLTHYCSDEDNVICVDNINGKIKYLRGYLVDLFWYSMIPSFIIQISLIICSIYDIDKYEIFSNIRQFIRDIFGLKRLKRSFKSTIFNLFIIIANLLALITTIPLIKYSYDESLLFFSQKNVFYFLLYNIISTSIIDIYHIGMIYKILYNNYLLYRNKNILDDDKNYVWY